MAGARDQQPAHQRSGQRSEARPGRDLREHSPRLLSPEDVAHQAPCDRDQEKIEHRQPDVEDPADPEVRRIGAHRQAKGEQRCRREKIASREQAPPGKQRGERAEQRNERQRRQERREEQPLEVFDPAGDAHRFAHRAQHHVGREKQEEEEKSGDQRGKFVNLDRQQARRRSRQLMVADCMSAP